MSKPLTPMQSAAMPHPTANTSGRRSENEILRDNGFSIVARPNVGDPLWRRDGKIYLEGDALKQCGVTDKAGGELFRPAEPCCCSGWDQ